MFLSLVSLAKILDNLYEGGGTDYEKVTLRNLRILNEKTVEIYGTERVEIGVRDEYTTEPVLLHCELVDQVYWLVKRFSLNDFAESGVIDYKGTYKVYEDESVERVGD